MKTNILEQLREIAENSAEYAKRWKRENNGKIIGTFCSYAPEELIFAAGALPYRIFGTAGNITLADAHLQAYSCSLVRGALEDALSGRLDFLDGAIFPHTCDSIQRLSDIWRLNIDTGFHADVVLPVKLNTESAEEYMIGVLKKFKRNLEKEIGHEITEKELCGAIDVYNGIRECLQRIYILRRENPGIISGRDLHALIKSTMVMDRKSLLGILTRLTVDLEGREAVGQSSPKRLLLSGGICNTPDVYSVIEAVGGAVVWDDLCTGSRYFTGRIDPDGEPVESIARRYLQRAVCPAKHSGLTDRADNLIEMAGETRADGVIFMFLKFCDPHLFDYPYLKTSLDEAGIPSLFLEFEEQMPTEGQLRTRFEAFIEML